jgi:hypothetical protein
MDFDPQIKQLVQYIQLPFQREVNGLKDEVKQYQRQYVSMKHIHAGSGVLSGCQIRSVVRSMIRLLCSAAASAMIGMVNSTFSIANRTGLRQNANDVNYCVQSFEMCSGDLELT